MQSLLQNSLKILYLFLFSAPVLAADFDEDGLDDFILIDINESSALEWFAIDLNDTSRRSLGAFGKEGVHLALGKWTGDGKSALGYTEKLESGEYQWYLGLSSGLKVINFGKDPEKVISGYDQDRNGAIDPVTISTSGGSMTWKILLNPAMEASPITKEIVFGTDKDIPFYADIDGTGDRLGIAKLNNKKVLSLTFLNPVTNVKQKVKVRNFQGGVSAIYPVAMDTGEDLLFILDKTGANYKFTVVSDGVKIKKMNVPGDEVVVGRYIESASESLVVRSSSGSAAVMNPFEKKSTFSINLDGILADEININSFGAPSSPIVNPPTAPTPPANKPGYPVCSGIQSSTEHLLYKPVSDTTGNVVIVFDSKYSRELVSVKLELKDGSFADGFWKGLALWGNPDAGGNRQHWRTLVRSSQVADNALIIANDGSQECQFRIPGSANRRWE